MGLWWSMMTLGPQGIWKTKLINGAKSAARGRRTAQRGMKAQLCFPEMWYSLRWEDCLIWEVYNIWSSPEVVSAPCWFPRESSNTKFHWATGPCGKVWRFGPPKNGRCKREKVLPASDVCTSCLNFEHLWISLNFELHRFLRSFLL